MCFMACCCVVTVAGLLRLALLAFRHARIPRVYGTSRRSEALSYFGESADAYGCYETKPRWRIYVRQSRRVIFWSTKRAMAGVQTVALTASLPRRLLSASIS